ncbi:MAG: TonB-dependent receptor, partial [Ignavibacteriales bacterium]|nr:TonB-dependent receptor [Ignavibacteriales bacterium]
WLDFNDILGNTDLIQVQRGTGNAVFGYPAVGGAINIVTSTASMNPEFIFGSSMGGFNTRKYNVSYSSGLINRKYAFTAKFSKTLSSGYREKSWVDFSSFYLSLLRFDDLLSTQFNIYGGPISDGLAYTGMPKSYIKNKALRKSNYSDWGGRGDDFYSVSRRNEEKENFSQPHFEILNEYKLSSNIRVNSALFLILGKGFFDYDGSWAPYSYYRLTSENGFTVTGNPDTLPLSNVLTRAQVENRQWGWIPRVKISDGHTELNLGAEIRFHNSLHWGAVNFANGGPSQLTPDFKYYSYEASKNMFSAFGNYSWQVKNNLRLLWEVQLAYSKYKIYNEHFIDNSFAVSHVFLNPKFGVNYILDERTAEASGGATPQFAVNSTGSYKYEDPLVLPETMSSLEIGGIYRKDLLELSANAYYMIFANEIVKNGQLDRFGSPVTGNVSRTNHAGLEFSGSYRLQDDFRFLGNLTLSTNKIIDGSTFIKYKDALTRVKTTTEIDLSGNKISGFPGFLCNFQAIYEKENIFVQLTSRFNGSFYSDNFDESLANLQNTYNNFLDYDDNKNDAFFTADIFASYLFKDVDYLKSIKVYMQINNIFNTLYSQNAVGKEFFPGAERNLLTGIQLTLD